VGDVEALQAQQRQQRFVQRPPHAAAMVAAADVDRDVDRPLVGRAFVVA
jgi:hypothetical protein